MLFGNKYLTKAISATFLVLLLCIHSIKLLHTHSGQSFSHDLHKKNFIGKKGADCTICDYQLNKDSDGFVASLFVEPVGEFVTLQTQVISSYNFSFYTAFENRGPPVI